MTLPVGITMRHDPSPPGPYSFGLTRMIWAGMRHSWRVSVSVALGVATATAVIVGALLVGDSMRGSLRELTVERLGRTEAAVIPGGFFRLADGRAGGGVRITRDGVAAAAVIMFDSGMIEIRDDDGSVVARAGSVQIIGCDESFWDLDASNNRPDQLPDNETVVLNESTAAELGITRQDVQRGVQVTVRLPVDQAVPADSPLGRRDTQSEGLPRMRVVDILPDRGLGRFAMSPNQAAPKNVFLSRATIGDALERDDQANLLLFDQPVTDDDLEVDLQALGLTLRRVRREFTEDGSTEVIYDYYWLTSDRLLLPEAAVDQISAELPPEQVTLTTTYLANAIEKLDPSGAVIASIPYSTITAIDSSPGLPLNYDLPDEAEEAPPPLFEGAILTDALADDATSRESAPLADAGPSQGERENRKSATSEPPPSSTAARVPLVLNRWAAERLGADVGTPLRIAYYEPEVENGKEIERYFSAVVTDIVPITKPAKPYYRSREATFDSRPTVYNDPDLTPTVPGVTDQDSINDWDLPFRLEREISDEDDLYWNEYRLTPKAFLPLSDGERLFGSRFGKTTGIRIASRAAADLDSLRERIVDAVTPVLGELGWSVRPLRERQLAASRGTTPFDGLFLALSFFVIMAAVMLIAMLFRLGLTQRSRQYGTLLAVGWNPRRVARLAFGEGLLVAAVGVAIGLLGGVLYAWGVLWALRSWWVGAVTVPFLTFHWTAASLIIGVASGWLVAAVTLWGTTRWLLRADAQTLLSGRDPDVAAPRRRGASRLPRVAAVTGMLALVIAGFGAGTGGQTAAGAFVGGGMLLLVAALLWLYARLRRPRRISAGDPAAIEGYSLGGMAWRNASRHPLRSTMTIGLMATAAFLIIAMAAFRLQPSQQGTGGFTLIGTSSQPLYRDFRDGNVQAELLGPDADQVSRTIVAPVRLRVGQDASCNNLYQATRPTVLGIPESFGQLFGDGKSLPGFQWAATEAAEGQSPWDTLNRRASGTEADPIPVIIDQNTAMWSLQMTGGLGERRTFEYQQGRGVTFEVVGLLSNSILQGRLLIGETNFEQLFPDISGYRFFLLADDPQRSDAIAAVMENRLSDIGMDISSAPEVLAGLMAVQNTYLRTFQSLGALGLLLGTVGLAVAQLRSVLERRQEIAVLRAIGFTRQRLGAAVISETASLLLLGIGCGGICALLAVLPHAVISGLRPPVVEPLLMVAGIIVFGMLAGLLAVRRVARMPLLESLRSE